MTAMMTPQEVSQHAFSKAVMGGYNMAMVDEFLDALTEDYTTLYKENAILKSKLKVLAEKVEEYRSTEDAMRSALLTAQKMATNLVEEAKAKRKELLESTEAVAREKMNALQHEIASEQLRMITAQKETAAFVEKIRRMYAEELTFLDKLGAIEAPALAAEIQGDGILNAAQEIESSISRMMTEKKRPDVMTEDMKTGIETDDPEQEEAEGGLYSDIVNGEIQQEQDRKEESYATNRIDFKNLQFGKNYEMK